ncbi:monovalent cation/H+ antiporter subunit D [uncultured Marinobacter sp.]|mgnify:CR=1 FL=1|uniref:monovalent cation/H+ antiporter subunit D n=1 Tax=uncultured Marinobacter sp. TaxID=187379 RepID=UPI0030D77BE1
MNHLMILPILIPLIAGASLLLVYRYKTGRQRSISVTSTVLLTLLGVWALVTAGSGDYLIYQAGNWQAPFGIVLVLDRLSAVMLALTSGLALFCVLYACRGIDRQGAHFHALFQFQLAGINGAFLTGDLFNLFVFFEVLLIASYALLLHGGGRARSRAGLHYVIINLVGSALFLLALGILYGLTGTLNMADLAIEVAGAGDNDRALLTGASMLLLVVFGIKAAILPLLFWLPRAYSSASAPVAALFAIMTKVGIYAMVRVFLLVFGLGESPVNETAWGWVWPLALLTLALGGVGVLGSASLRTKTAYLVIVSVGTLLATLSFVTTASLAAALFYLIHSTCMTAVFFLLADLVGRHREQGYDRFTGISPVGHRWLLGTLFFVAAVSLAGLPPFSGFVSKLWILQATSGAEDGFWLWAVLLSAALLTITAMSRAGSSWFWKPGELTVAAKPLDRKCFALVWLMTGVSVVLSVMAEPVSQYLLLTAEQLHAPEHYLQAVLPETFTRYQEAAR